jgi:hypothetical protein
MTRFWCGIRLRVRLEQQLPFTLVVICSETNMNTDIENGQRIMNAQRALVRFDAVKAFVDGIGPNGPQIFALEDNWPTALNILTETKDADVIGAFFNEETEHRIDLHWGFTSDNPREKGQGLAKLLRWHPDVVAGLDQIIRFAAVVAQPTADRYILSDGKHLIVISQRHNNAPKNWLVTAFNAGSKPSKRDRALLNFAKNKISQAISRTVDGANVAGQTNVSIAGTNSTDRLAINRLADVAQKINDE